MDDRGYIFVSSLLLMFMVAVLGGTYFVVSNFEVTNARTHAESIQSYYLARSGAEAGLEWVIANEDEIKEEKTVFLTGEINEEGLEKSFIEPNDVCPIFVKIKYDEGENCITIDSRGRSGNQEIQKGTTLILDGQVEGQLIPIENAGGLIPMEGYYDADHDHIETAQELGWTSGQGQSGNIKPGEYSVECAVIIDGPGNSVKLNNGTADFEAEALYFQNLGSGNNNHDFQIHQQGKLILTADRIVFYTDVEINTTGSGKSGELCLHPRNNNSIVHFEKPLIISGEMYVEKGTYYIPATGICLPNGGGTTGSSPIQEWPREWR